MRANPEEVLAIDAAVAGFDVLSELGRGADSVVYRVRRIETGRQYALKMLSATPDDAHVTLRAFLREAALLASVDHPGLPVIHEAGEHNGRPYLVMDLVEGEQLAEVLAGGSLSAERVIELARGVASQLAAMHRRGLVHRDIKPQNIMIPPVGEVKLIDFGLATQGIPGHSDSTVGTMVYISPEQAGVLRRPTDNRSDLYSLGVVLFECLAGYAPFEAADAGELLRMHAMVAPPDLRLLVPDVPDGVVAVVETLLAKDPDDRYQNAEQLLADLELLNRSLTTPVVPRDAGRLLARVAQPLAGRSAEFEMVEAEWTAAAAGAGRACVIRGAPGGGKSRLALELAMRAGAEGALVMQGKCSPDDPVPLGPLRAALDGYLAEVACLPARDRDLAHERMRAASAHGGLGGLSPALDTILGEFRLSDGQDQFTVSVATFIADLARSSGGLLLLIDDVQWLDPGTVRVLTQLAAQLDGTPILMLGTARDDAASMMATDEAMSSWGSAVALDLTLPPLDAAGVRDLVAGMLPRVDVGSGLSRLLDVRGNGNPFVIQEFVRAIVDAGLLRPSWGRWLLDETALDALDLPQDAWGLVLTRVRGLAPEARELLITAAAIGARFAPDLVTQIHGLELAAVLDVTVEAAQRGLIEPRDDGSYGFVHDRIREALLESLNGESLAHLHLRIARALDSAPTPDGGHLAEHVYAVAQHYLPAPEGVDVPQKRAAFWAAGRLALDSHSPTEAVTYLRRAAHLQGADAGVTAGQDVPAARLAMTLADALRQDAQFDEALERLSQALEWERDPLVRAAAYAMMADVHRSCWDTPAAAAAVQQGLRELGAGVPGGVVLQVLSTFVMFLAALAMQWTGVGFGSASGAQRARSTAVGALHEVGSYVAVLSLKPGQALLHSLRGLYWANRLGDGAQHVRNLGSFGFLCGQLGMRAASARIFARVRANPAAAEPGLAALMAHYQGASMYLGYLDDGEAWAAAEAEARWLDPASFCDLVNSLVGEDQAQGRTRAVQERLRRARHRLSHRVGELAWLSIGESTSHAQCGRVVEAVEALQRAESVFGEHPPLGVAMMLHAARATVLREQGETGVPFDDAVALFEATQVPIPIVIRAMRVTYFSIAMGRLDQCRVAAGDDRHVRLAQARSAVRQLRRSARGASQKARAGIARSDLLVLEGRPKAALATLARTCDVLLPDAPLLAYEVARVRARALTDIGVPQQARRQAQLALSIAEDSGWPHRISWVRSEFGVGYPPGQADAGAVSAAPRHPPKKNSSVSGASSTSRMMRRLEALEEVGAAASRVLDPGELARITLDETIRILSADRAFLFLIDDADRLVPHLGRDAAGQDVAELAGYSASLVERVHHGREPLIVTGTDEGAALGAQSVVLHGLRSIMVAPLMLEGRLLGVVYLDSQVAKGIFVAEDVGILTALTNHIATSLETARAAQLEISVQTARRQRDLADGLREALEAMSSAADPHQVLARLMRWAVELTSATRSWVLSDDGRASTVTSLPADSRPGMEDLVIRSLDRDANLEARLSFSDAIVGSPQLVPVGLHDQLAGSVPWVALPLRTGDGVTRCVLLASTSPDAHLDQELEVAGALASLGVTAHQKAALFEQLQALAVEDELTGVPNRRRFFEVAARDIAAAVRAGLSLTAMMIDIDHFKRVNDTYGHLTGDDVIREVASRLSTAMRHTDLLGRYGGEEFAFLALDSDLPDDLAERLRACVADTPVETRSGPIKITVSIGTVHLSATRSTPPNESTQSEGMGVEHLLSRADQALYVAKQQGRNRVVRSQSD